MPVSRISGDGRQFKADDLTEAERRFPVRVKVAIPPAVFGERLNRVHARLYDNCGADGWDITLAPTGRQPILWWARGK
jgi:hypothetical protein